MKVIKKDIPQLCWVCKGKKCPVCHNTGMWKERIYYMIVKDKNGKEYAFDGDSIK
jgi:hypothetical protein